MQSETKHVVKEWLAVAALSVFALLVHGYHPYAEDGGLYVAGIKKLLHPAFFSVFPEFVTEHLRFSLFAPLVAGFVKVAHVPLPWMLLGLYLASVAATLAAGLLLARRCICTRAGRLGAVALLACWLALPVAGTSLLLADPYLTARSFSTPLVLLALVFALDATLNAEIRKAGRWWLCSVALALAATMHPLMAGYGIAAVLLLAVLQMRFPIVGAAVLAIAALGLAGTLQLWAPAESCEYLQVALTRYYWFPGQWRWFEQMGLLAPLLVLLGLIRWSGWQQPRGAGIPLAKMAVAFGVIALAVAISFCRAGLAAHLVARLQPLRSFQIVYLVMILLLGAWAGELLSRLRFPAFPLVMVALVATLGGLMFFVARDTYGHSNHLELPWIKPENRWEQAFLWIRSNTPEDAVVAMDARYITRGRDEDAQCFRAIAERSAIPDYSKDGGVASLDPALTGEWMRGEQAQEHLETSDDLQRAQAVVPLGATWMVLESSSRTAWSCLYANDAVKVCRIP